MDAKNRVLEFDYVDFEKVVFGWQHFLRYFELGKMMRVIAESDPCNPKIDLVFLESNEHGEWKEKAHGSINRTDCMRFFSFSGLRIFKKFKSGKKQRIIVEYDPQNEKASIAFQEIR